jgi:endonuclease III
VLSLSRRSEGRERTEEERMMRARDVKMALIVKSQIIFTRVYCRVLLKRCGYCPKQNSETTHEECQSNILYV